jgi:hypothetical protein
VDKLIGMIDHTGRVSDIDSIKLVQGQLYQLKMTKKFQAIKESKAKNGTERSKLYSKHFVLTNYGNYRCFLRPFPLSDL